MFTVAFIGPDGSGKTTVLQLLKQNLPMSFKYLYMGFVIESSNIMLPTTRFFYAAKRTLKSKKNNNKGSRVYTKSNVVQTKGYKKGILSRIKSNLRLINLLFEELFRYLMANYYKNCGYVVLFDRHFLFDSRAYDVFNRGLHRFLLGKVYPKPDLVIYLDAPAEVLFSRKGEESVEKLELRRQRYLNLRDVVKHFITVETTHPPEITAQYAADHIIRYHKTRAGKGH
jgi:thymidylate kinase